MVEKPKNLLKNIMGTRVVYTWTHQTEIVVDNYSVSLAVQGTAPRMPMTVEVNSLEFDGIQGAFYNGTVTAVSKCGRSSEAAPFNGM